MNTSKLKKLAAAALVPVALITAPVPSPAAAPETGIVSPNYTAITNIDCQLKLKDSGDLNCYAFTKVYSNYSAKVTVELQRLDGSWETKATWNAEGGSRATVNEDYSAKSGKYRLKVTHSSYDSSGKLVDKVIAYSDTVSV